jgi:hypothetical protein
MVHLHSSSNRANAARMVHDELEKMLAPAGRQTQRTFFDTEIKEERKESNDLLLDADEGLHPE